MRSRLPIFFFLTFSLGVALLPLAAHAASFPFFGPIVGGPGNLNGVQTCPAGWAAFADVLNNLLAFAITILIVFIAPLFIAWAGFLYVVSPANPSNRGKANKILINTIVGIIIALAAWLIVDFLLTALTSPSRGVSSWTSQLFSGGDYCLSVATDVLTPPPTNVNAGSVTLTPDQACASDGGAAADQAGAPSGSAKCEDGTTATETVLTGTELTTAQACAGHGGPAASGGAPVESGSSNTTTSCVDGSVQCMAAGASVGNNCAAPTTSNDVPLNSSGTGGCDASVVSNAASQAGYNLASSQANALACISGAEDSCGSGSVKNYNWGHGASSAGAYQVQLDSHSNCYDNAVCEQAVNQAGTPLNCGSAFSGGNVKSDPASQALANRCLQAAANVNCDAAAAACLTLQNPSMSDWASAGDNACKSKYGI